YLWLAQRLSLSVKRVVEVAENIAKGDLRQSVEVDQRDEIGRLQNATKSMIENLSGTISEVRSSSSALATSSARLSSTAHNLSEGTSEQAVAAEETSTSLEQISA